MSPLPGFEDSQVSIGWVRCGEAAEEKGVLRDEVVTVLA